MPTTPRPPDPTDATDTEDDPGRSIKSPCVAYSYSGGGLRETLLVFTREDDTRLSMGATARAELPIGGMLSEEVE